MKCMKVINFGPIAHLDIDVGDLTFLLGPQASGKTLFLQLLKLLMDKTPIVQTLERYNYVIDNDPDKVLNCFFGDRLSTMWKEDTKIEADGTSVAKGDLLAASANGEERVFYIPAQRILSIADGRPKNFMEYDLSSPYVLRSFSEKLRLYFQQSMSESALVFPSREASDQELQTAFDRAIFHGGKVIIDEQSGQKKMRMQVGGSSLPFMTWSAGQKEFMPLLMAFHCLSTPAGKTMGAASYKYIVIEEPEMGLHPKAIQTVILQILSFIRRGYKVIVSTHSSVLLEFAWAYRLISGLPADIQSTALSELFDLPPAAESRILEGVLGREVKTYFFAHTDLGVQTRDISTLDVGSQLIEEAEWGGLSEFASKASEVVSNYLMQYDTEE